MRPTEVGEWGGVSQPLRLSRVSIRHFVSSVRTGDLHSEVWASRRQRDPQNRHNRKRDAFGPNGARHGRPVTRTRPMMEEAALLGVTALADYSADLSAGVCGDCVSSPATGIQRGCASDRLTATLWGAFFDCEIEPQSKSAPQGSRLNSRF